MKSFLPVQNIFDSGVKPVNDRSFSLRLASVALLATVLLGSVAPGFSQSARPDRVTFFCKQVFDRASGNKIPATLAWVPGRGGNVRIIGWKSEYFRKSSPARCEEVSRKFQTAFDGGRFNYLTTGKAKGYPIVCAVARTGDPCDGNSQLFTVKPHDNPDLVLQQLMDILEGKTSDMLLQSSGNKTYVSMTEFFAKAPLADRDAPPCTISGGPQMNCRGGR
ncbi:COP23 domain-containing protein [Pannus brasiliensis CCIBt3594]|uniref:COP23 domain-containing protein n=1 Tax=Pannus brasiliensis CCIBt3594 TaxID=1427578 RepID=A0AAW9QY84_9CHRO